MTVEKKLDALIDALGFDVEETCKTFINGAEYGGTAGIFPVTPMDDVTHAANYKLTKRQYNKKPMLHRIVRMYEKGEMEHDEMVARIIDHGKALDEDITG